MRVITWIASHAIAIATAAWLFEGIRFAGPSSGRAEFTEKFVPVLVVSVVLGLVTILVEPVVKLLSLPFIILTIGLFLLVINALMLMLTGWLAGQVGVGFSVDGFWTALFGSIVITIVTGFINLAADNDK